MAPVVLEGRLAELSREARAYPVHLLREGGTGLCLFAARFYGVNDAINMARNSMELTLVDTSERVLEMADMYECSAHQMDAWDFATLMSATRNQWDAVSVDTYTGDICRRSLDSLELWCSLARDVVTATHVLGMPYTVPDGWTDSLFDRNPKNGVNWLVLTRA
jgi:hypothetical protein